MYEWALTTITVNFVKKMFGVGFIFNLLIYLSFFQLRKKVIPNIQHPVLDILYIFYYVNHR